MLKTIFCLGLLVFQHAVNSFAQQNEYIPDPDPAIRQRITEWQDLKFGLLMHWGTYSQWGIVESWSICPEDLSWATGARKTGIADNYTGYVKKYEALKNTFNPVLFNPAQWAAAAKYAGMKYVVFTTKHHDGFCMFDSKFTDYKITDTGCAFSKNQKANITKEIFDAFRKENFWTGAYFSKPDWHSDYYWWKKFPPSDRNCNYSISKYPEQWKQFKDYTWNQINELVTGYGQLDILWLDGGWVRKTTDEEVKNYLSDIYEGSRWARNPQNQDIDMAGLVTEIRKKQPALIVVDRAVPGAQQNYLTPEQHIPENGLPYPWETCMTMANSWSFVPGDIYKPANELITKLVDIVSKGGNFLLNIGPGPDGQISDSAYARLKAMGDWMHLNGESIYGTKMYTVFGEGNTIRFTQTKDEKIQYIFLIEPTSGKQLISKMVFKKNAKLSLLGSGQKIKWTRSNEVVSFDLSEKQTLANKPVLVLQLVNR
jgi:alpha-L-fucosidase